MQRNTDSFTIISSVAKKELSLFFSSPIAYIFLASFATATLFIFFWVESFFARNISDVRPLFEWMPLLLLLLSSALTMKMWSEERKNGGLEFVLTRAVPIWNFVLGKFLACLLLLFIALAITLPLPLTVALLGELDWGPVWSGYFATLFLGASYLSIGLYVSAKSDNQIVSLISACALCGLFYLVGTPLITDLFGSQVGDSLRLVGTGSRFESITRGVIDIRDFYYYGSLIVSFLALNVYAVEKERWVTDSTKPLHKKWQLALALLVSNALIANFWLSQISILRLDMTEGRQYSISQSTETYLRQLQEPLLIRAYFSSKTHPLLSPLVPQLRDLIKEYEVAGKGNVRAEFVDPQSDPELEEEANQQYGIQPVPFQVADRYQSSIVSSYFNVLVKYGDEYQILNFRDLIEIKARSESQIDVKLRNPEHDLTRAIKKVLYSYQAEGNLFDTIGSDIKLMGYVSNDSELPAALIDFNKLVKEVTNDFTTQSGGRFSTSFVDPKDSDGAVAREIAEQYGFRPMSAGLFSDASFFYYLTLESGGQIVQLPIEDLSKEGFKRNLEAGIKRFATGFTKNVAMVSPAPDYSSPYGGSNSAQYTTLQDFLNSELNVNQEDLSDGSVEGAADILLLLGPKDLGEQEVYAVDQFLMKGGTVIASTSHFRTSYANRSLTMVTNESGLDGWLEHNGISIERQLVMDPQNSAFPAPVTRNIGGFQIQEMRMLDYPYFPDIRGSALNNSNLITSELPQLTMAWASPIVIDNETNKERTLTKLLQSSQRSWISDSLDILPRTTGQGISAFRPQGTQKSHLLGVIIEGRFESYFKGRNPPTPEAETPDEETAEAPADVPIELDNVVEHSPDIARIILFSSNEFLNDQTLQMLGSSQQTAYVNSIQMLTNSVDWSLEDQGLLSIRSRGHFNRTLLPMEKNMQVFLEYLNYALSGLVIIGIAFGVRAKRKSTNDRYQELLETNEEMA